MGKTVHLATGYFRFSRPLPSSAQVEHTAKAIYTALIRESGVKAKPYETLTERQREYWRRIAAAALDSILPPV